MHNITVDISLPNLWSGRICKTNNTYCHQLVNAQRSRPRHNGSYSNSGQQLGYSTRSAQPFRFRHDRGRKHSIVDARPFRILYYGRRYTCTFYALEQFASDRAPLGIINLGVIYYTYTCDFLKFFLTARLCNNKNICETRTLCNHNTSLSRQFFAVANHLTLVQYSSERRETRPTELHYKLRYTSDVETCRRFAII